MSLVSALVLVWFLPKSPKSLTPSDPSVLFFFWFAEQTRRDATSSVCARDVPSSPPLSPLPPSCWLHNQTKQRAFFVEPSEPSLVLVRFVFKNPHHHHPPIYSREPFECPFLLRHQSTKGAKVDRDEKRATPLNKKPLTHETTPQRPKMSQKDQKQRPKINKNERTRRIRTRLRRAGWTRHYRRARHWTPLY